MIAPRKKFRFKNKMFSVDATIIDLCITIFPWAKFRRAKGAVKLHMILDHDGYLPTFVHISDGKKADVKALPLMDFPEGSVIAMDRGYNDYRIFALWTEKKVWFVTRMKDNAVYRVVEKREIPKNRNIISDEVIELTGVKAEEKCPYLLRRVVVWDEENVREIVLLTNNFNFEATTIAAIYKERWQIELFFKAIKQNLKIKTFVGTTANALHIQIWTALIVMLLLKYMQFKSRLNWSMSNLAVMVAWNLFTYRDLWHWLDYPFETPPDGIEDIEQKMLFPDFGQQFKCLKATT
jgi:transposase